MVDNGDARAEGSTRRLVGRRAYCARARRDGANAGGILS